MTTLAQIVPELAPPTTIMGAFIVVSLGLMGLVGWLLRHLFTNTMPATIASFEKTTAGYLAEQKQQRESHERNIQTVVKAHADEAAAERRQCAEQFNAIHSALLGLTAAQGEDRVAMVASVNANTDKAVSAYRHELNNTIHEAVLGRELAAAQRLAKASGERGGAGEQARQTKEP